MKLNDRSWTVQRRLNEADTGGFGMIWVVHDEQGQEAVAKVVNDASGAGRETLIGEALTAAGHDHVVPILDHGQHGTELVLVMPRAEYSLAKYLEQHGRLTTEQAVPILRDVATALDTLDGVIVHRDLKPANVLLLDGRWCLADFGIARFADATTAADTHKYKKTRLYAAPEQWLEQRASAATDIYAFGAMAYELLAGTVPFTGPDFRDQHLNEDPPILTGVPDGLRLIVDDCLLKAPGSRPSAATVLARLKALDEAPRGKGFELLEAVDRESAKREDATYRSATAEQADQQWREQLLRSGERVFMRIVDELRTALSTAAPRVTFDPARPAGTPGPILLAKLENARLGVAPPVLSEARWSTPFTVIAESVISVNMPGSGPGGFTGRSHSLWYCDAQHEDRFAWYEVAFHQLFSLNNIVPTSMSANESHVVFENVTSSIGIARPFVEVDPTNLTPFLDRWLGWFAQAALGQLQHPGDMPEENPQGSWRTSGR
ncbi:protein kinase [Mycolicibacterium conceptionense]|uniref:protein kinase domain-containing protein n=1 Tax=Mycolicibacterium conceptionense TaxID=451644 RepID=UPI003204AA1B